MKALKRMNRRKCLPALCAAGVLFAAAPAGRAAENQIEVDGGKASSESLVVLAQQVFADKQFEVQPAGKPPAGGFTAVSKAEPIKMTVAVKKRGKRFHLLLSADDRYLLLQEDGASESLLAESKRKLRLALADFGLALRAQIYAVNYPRNPMISVDSGVSKEDLGHALARVLTEKAFKWQEPLLDGDGQFATFPKRSRPSLLTDVGAVEDQIAVSGIAISTATTAALKLSVRAEGEYKRDGKDLYAWPADQQDRLDSLANDIKRDVLHILTPEPKKK